MSPISFGDVEWWRIAHAGEISDPNECPDCGGSGDCSWCDGTGLVTPDKDDDEPCEECEGSGVCARCKGLGERRG